MKTKELTRIAMLSAVALIVFAIEARIPSPVPIAGIKLGLANVITLFAIWSLGRKQAGIILLVRIVLGSFVAGTLMTMFYSLAGGLLSYLIMCLTKGLFTQKQLWAHSILGAIGHNTGQMAVALFVTGTPSLLLVYGPPLLLSAIITGLFTGLCAQAVLRQMTKIKQF